MDGARLSAAGPPSLNATAIGPSIQELYAGQYISTQEWFDKFQCYKAAGYGRAIANNQWYDILRHYCDSHPGLVNALEAIPVHQRGSLNNIRVALTAQLFPDGQPGVAANARRAYYSFEGLPDRNDPLAVLEVMRQQINRMNEADRPTDAQQVTNLLDAIGPEHSTYLDAVRPANLEAAATALRQSASRRLPGRGRPAADAPPAPYVPIFTAMGGGGDPYGNRINPAVLMHPLATTMAAQAPSPSVIPEQKVKELLTDAVADMKQQMEKTISEQQKLINAQQQALLRTQQDVQKQQQDQRDLYRQQQNHHSQQMETLTATINAINTGYKRLPASPPRGGGGSRYDADRYEKRGRYGENQHDRQPRRECKYCRQKGWQKANTHFSEECFQHPNKAIAEANWQAYKARAGITGGRGSDRREDRPPPSNPKAAPSDDDIQERIEREANKRLQQMQEKAAEDDRNQKIDALHQWMLQHPEDRRSRDGGEHST